ncbi:MAG: hypothetical protein AAF591_00065 [Verrucomicrobiota bacterium]
MHTANMNPHPTLRSLLATCLAIFCLHNLPTAVAQNVDVSQSGKSRHFQISETDDQLTIDWPIDETNRGQVQLSLTNPERLLQAIKIQSGTAEPKTILLDSAPVWQLFVGEREANDEGPYTFFDKVDERGYDEFPLRLAISSVHTEILENRAHLRLSKLTGDDFSGELQLTFFAHSPLIQLEAIVSTPKKNRAILYRAGLGSPADQITSLTYHIAGGTQNTIPRDQMVDYHPAPQIEVKRTDGLGRGGFDPAISPLIGKVEEGLLQAKYRTVALQTAEGSVGIFPPPHKFLPPLDFAENVGFNFAWRKKDGTIEAGIRQPPLGDGRYRPWVDCPPNSRQHLDLFLLISDQPAQVCLEEIAAYTNHDRYPELDGYRTFSSHYHMWHARELIMAQQEQETDSIPEAFELPLFVKRFKEIGMDIVHLAEFHGGPNTGLSRYPELQVLHRECARLSDDEILILPGEEPNVHLGGHWISFFPRPVYWDWPDKKSLRKQKQQMVNGKFPDFERNDPELGTVYFINSAEDMLRLAEKEEALVWTAHPRIKGSTGYPDRYREEDYYTSPTFLGAAWKAMPANYSDDRLGRRVLDLLDDMNQWGQHKQILAEADLFKLNAASELYGHNNVNYLKLANVPKFNNGWAPVLDALRTRQYFSGTGEVLIRSLTYNGKEFPSQIPASNAGAVDIVAELKWTFPLSFAEIISGDGDVIFRERIDLSDTGAFGDEQLINHTIDLSDRTWVRFEVWDVAQNGAFTQTVRIQ